MIAFISGFINHKDHENNSIIIVNNGIGYEVTVKDTTIFKDVKVELWISTVQREDGITLYGFVEFEQRKLFNRLISVPGVGPKTALLVLGKYEPDEFYTVVKQIMINQKLGIKQYIKNEIDVTGIGPVAAVKIVSAISKVLSS